MAIVIELAAYLDQFGRTDRLFFLEAGLMRNILFFTLFHA
jgi:hypothetical protein